MKDNAPVSNRDRDCASMARDALFPLRINKDGTHPTLFPALAALGKVRDDAMDANPDRASSSFFPRRVVVVRAIAGNEQSQTDRDHGELQWNGQPEISAKDASFEVIPQLLSVRCMECAKAHPQLKAFIKAARGEEFEQRRLDNREGAAREIVLCTDRLLKSDYSPEQRTLDLPPRSFAAVEESLAHQITKVRDELKFDRSNSREHASRDAVCDPTSCKGLASSEIRAARAAECYYSKAGKEVKRGSCLPYGYSLLPYSLQRLARDRCVRSVATKATQNKFGKDDGRKCVEDVFDKVIR